MWSWLLLQKGMRFWPEQLRCCTNQLSFDHLLINMMTSPKAEPDPIISKADSTLYTMPHLGVSVIKVSVRLLRIPPSVTTPCFATVIRGSVTAGRQNILNSPW